MLRRNDVKKAQDDTLRKARQQSTPGPQLSRPMTGPASGIQAGTVDENGNWIRFGQTDIDSAEEFYTS